MSARYRIRNFFSKTPSSNFFVKFHKDFGHLFIPQKSILFTLLFLRFSIENKRSASKMTQSYLDHEKMANLSRVFLPNCIFTVKSQKKRGRPGWQKVLRKLGNIFFASQEANADVLHQKLCFVRIVLGIQLMDCVQVLQSINDLSPFLLVPYWVPFKNRLSGLSSLNSKLTSSEILPYFLYYTGCSNKFRICQM